jgi:hypothetical protein
VNVRVGLNVNVDQGSVFKFVFVIKVPALLIIALESIFQVYFESRQVSPHGGEVLE